MKSVATTIKRQDVDNFEVSDFHTYFVGEHGVWEHNKCGDIVDFDPNTLERTHSISGKKAIKKVENIAQSMKQQGFIGDGIDIVEYNGKRYVIDGHYRLAAAKRANVKVNINVVTDLKSHHSNFNYIEDVLKSAEYVGLDNLKSYRRR